MRIEGFAFLCLKEYLHNFPLFPAKIVPQILASRKLEIAMSQVTFFGHANKLRNDKKITGQHDELLEGMGIEISNLIFLTIQWYSSKLKQLNRYVGIQIALIVQPLYPCGVKIRNMSSYLMSILRFD